MIKLPKVLQKKGHDCGLAAATCVGRYYGRKLRTPDGWPCPIDGTDPRILEPYFRANGFGVQSGEMVIEDLVHHTRAQRPVLALVQSHGVGHWVVVSGVSAAGVHFMDPATGLSVEPSGGFWSRWSDVCRDGSSFRGWGIAVWVI